MVINRGNFLSDPNRSGFLLQDGEEAHYCHDLSVALAIQEAMRAVCGRSLSIQPLGSQDAQPLARRNA